MKRAKCFQKYCDYIDYFISFMTALQHFNILKAKSNQQVRKQYFFHITK